ncbi:MAG TPA: diadenylate cyclase CdaA [Candidatus Butyricicoccus avistercoris]|uniref:Diadenylate cyclase n=1 Tax=Candidatus Butyricicoccus avistercoris TaxID=2838518 RepID=A0A9D1PI94_9FIRM|nr:diadenylate cyclase CdaA [Candidatus Butyricicoccus avistercoris]
MEFWENYWLLVKNGSITDIIDIAIVAFLVYHLIRFVKNTSAERLLKGVVILLAAQLIASRAYLNTISFVLEKTFYYGVIALLIVFQPELRRLLEQIGMGHVTRLLVRRENGQTEIDYAITQTVLACESMSWSRTGALMVFERMERLGEVTKTGTRIDAEPSAELIKNIFYPKSPLHDGAMVLRDGRIHSAGCVLPLSKNLNLSRELGTRHRSAVGMSEVSDAVIVVVSEETGAISVAIGGMLKRQLDSETLRKILEAELITNTVDKKKKKSNLLAGRKDKK